MSAKDVQKFLKIRNFFSIEYYFKAGKIDNNLKLEYLTLCHLD